MTAADMWTYREQTWVDVDLSGYGVEARDGSIGSVHEATNDVGTSYIVVDTGPWIFGKKVLLPAGVIERIDTDDEKIYVNQTKDQIKDSPEFDESTYRDEEYRGRVGEYYGGTRYDDPLV